MLMTKSFLCLCYQALISRAFCKLKHLERLMCLLNLSHCRVMAFSLGFSSIRESYNIMNAAMVQTAACLNDSVVSFWHFHDVSHQSWLLCCISLSFCVLWEQSWQQKKDWSPGGVGAKTKPRETFCLTCTAAAWLAMACHIAWCLVTSSQFAWMYLCTLALISEAFA